MTRNHANRYRSGQGIRACAPVILGAVCAVTPLARAQCVGTWAAATPFPAPPPAPASRGYSGIAYDPVGARVLIYGGGTNSAGFRDLWRWDGSTWASFGLSAAGNRKGPALTWDAARSRLVLFGGAFATTNDTWEWDGTTWTQVATAGPALRGFTAMVYEPPNARSVLFGGWSSGFNYFGDTWAWNGTAWTQLALTGPTPHARGFHAMAYDASRARVVLFGGLWNDASSSNILGDTWEFDGTTWTQKFPATSPPPRGYHGMTYEPVGHRVVLHGGLDSSLGNYFSDTWIWDGTNWSLLPDGTFSPFTRLAFAMTYDAARAKCTVFGGALTSTFRNDTWTLALPTCCVADVDDGTMTGHPDGGVTIDDLLYYLFIFDQGLIAADVDDGTGTGTHDGGVTIDDLLYYLARFDAGC